MLRWGLRVAALTFVLDQAVKYVLLYIVDMPSRQLIEVTGFFNLRMAWNKGVSFGMFSADTDTGRYLLIFFALAVVAVLLVWLARVHSRLLALSIGLVIGGAVANVTDRVIHGAVADFFDLHAWGYHFYTFNIADTAISLGVVLLIYESMFLEDSSGARRGEQES